MRKVILAGLAFATLSLGCTVADAQTHAMVKTSKVTLSGIKKVAGAVLFAVEDGVDVVHAATSGADKALMAVSASNKILVPVQKAVGFADEYVGKLDTGLERAESVLFGVSN